jgi:hypothetical protein
MMRVITISTQLKYPLLTCFVYELRPVCGDGDINLDLVAAALRSLWLKRGLMKTASFSYILSFLLIFLNIFRMYSMSISSLCFSSPNLTFTSPNSRILISNYRNFREQLRSSSCCSYRIALYFCTYSLNY